MAGEKTEQPTQRRLDDARKKGQVARSREVDSAIVLLAAFTVFRFGGGYMWNSAESLIVDTFAELDRDPLTTELTGVLGPELVGRGVLVLAPLLLAIVGLALLGGVAQTGGPLFSPQALKPQGSRLNPLQGAKRLFASKQALTNLAKSLGKFALLGGVSFLVIWLRREELFAIGLNAGLLPSLGVARGPVVPARADGDGRDAGDRRRRLHVPALRLLDADEDVAPGREGRAAPERGRSAREGAARSAAAFAVEPRDAVGA